MLNRWVMTTVNNGEKKLCFEIVFMWLLLTNIRHSWLKSKRKNTSVFHIIPELSHDIGNQNVSCIYSYSAVAEQGPSQWELSHMSALIGWDFAQLQMENRPWFRYHSWYGLSQWEKALLCNASSHWPSPCPEWSLLVGKVNIMPANDLSHNIQFGKK